MRATVHHLFIVLGLAVIAGCGFDPEFDLPEKEDKIVVDGWIENSDQATVFLTANASYFSSIDSASWRDIVLSRAKVTLDDGDQSEVLILRKDTRYFPPYYYAGNEIFGEPGKTYTITAEYGGKIVRSQTTIPEPVSIDTCYFELLEETDTVGLIVIEFSDPPDEKNYYRIFTMRQGLDERYISTFIMAIDDQYFPGSKISLTLLRAPESQLYSKEDSYFRIGETILVKLSSMDKASYDFWSSLQDEILNSSHPFASSLSEIHSNIEGDGLGIWSGYGSSVDTIVARR